MSAANLLIFKNIFDKYSTLISSSDECSYLNYLKKGYPKLLGIFETLKIPGSNSSKTKNMLLSRVYFKNKLFEKKSISKNDTQLSKHDADLLKDFNDKYPKIKSIVSLKISELYKKIHSTPLKNFTLVELQFLLKFYFDAKLSSRNTKQDLYDSVLNNIYQNNYLDSLNAGYSIDLK